VIAGAGSRSGHCQQQPVDLDKVAGGLVLAVLLSLAFGTMPWPSLAWRGNRGAAAGIPHRPDGGDVSVQTPLAQIESLASHQPLSLFIYYLGHNAAQDAWIGRRRGPGGGRRGFLAAFALPCRTGDLAA